MSATLIRPATAADALGIGQAHVAASRAAYAEIYSPDYLAALTPEKRAAAWLEPGKGHLVLPDPAIAVFVAEQRGAIMGFADCGPADQAQHPGAGELYALYLIPAANGQGLGTQLFQTAVAHLRSYNFTALVTSVLARNDAARGFYEKRDGRALPGTQRLKTGGVEADVMTYHWPVLPA